MIEHKSDRVLRFPDLRERKGIPFSRVHVWRLVRRGEFPAPIHLGENTRGWLESEIDAYIADRAAARTKVEAA